MPVKNFASLGAAGIMALSGCATTRNSKNACEKVPFVHVDGLAPAGVDIFSNCGDEILRTFFSEAMRVCLDTSIPRSAQVAKLQILYRQKSFECLQQETDVSE